MTSFTNSTTLFHNHHPTTTTRSPHRTRPLLPIRASSSGHEKSTPTHHHRRKLVTTFLATSLALGLNPTPIALSEAWGTRAFIWERFFEPGLSPENSVARIRQTAEGLHSIRDMLEAMAWRYVLFYIRVKQVYLEEDMRNAFSMVPEIRRQSYINTANELTDNMAEFDSYIRTPKVYESYLFYEKTLKSIDELVALLPP